jgi:hypothetical protein
MISQTISGCSEDLRDFRGPESMTIHIQSVDSSSSRDSVAVAKPSNGFLSKHVKETVAINECAACFLRYDLDLSDKPYKALRYHSTGLRGTAFHRTYPLFASCADDAAVHVFHGMVSAFHHRQVRKSSMP